MDEHPTSPKKASESEPEEVVKSTDLIDDSATDFTEQTTTPAERPKKHSFWSKRRGKIIATVGIGVFFGYALTHTDEVSMILSDILQSLFPEECEQAKLEHWIETCSDEGLSKAHYDICYNCMLNKQEFPPEEELMRNELNRRYRERYKDMPVSENHIPWKNEPLFDRD